MPPTRLIPFMLLTAFWLSALASRAIAKPVDQPFLISELSFPQSFQSGPHTMRIPFQLVGRLIVVQAKVGELRGNFVVDTGADKLVLNSNYYDGGIVRTDEVALGVGGKIGTIKSKTVDSLELEQLRWYKLPADLVDLSTIESNKNTAIFGLLGYSVWKDYELFFDYGIKQLILTTLDEDGTPLDPLPYGEAPTDTLDAELKGHLLCVDAKVEGYSVEMGLDSGAELNLLDRNVKREVLDHFLILKRVKLVGAGGKDVEVLAGKLSRVRVSGIPCSPMNTLLTSMDELNRMNKTKITGILGYEFFGTRRMAINYKKQKIYFFGWQRP